jgi:hypothetical protein
VLLQAGTVAYLGTPEELPGVQALQPGQRRGQVGSINTAPLIVAAVLVAISGRRTAHVTVYDSFTTVLGFRGLVMDDQNLKMTDQEGSPAKAPAYRTTRMEAFSDGVFAIATTLLVPEIAIPARSEDDLLGAVLGQWPLWLTW